MLNRRHIGIFYEKKGISTILLTLIIIVLSFVAIGILWGVLGDMITKQSEITQLQSAFFNEQINIMGLKYSEPLLNITLRRPSGIIKAEEINMTPFGALPLEADIFSVVDLTGSMRQCWYISPSQCSNLGGVYSPPCDSLQEDRQSGCISYGGTWVDKLIPTQDANRQLIDEVLISGDTRVGLVGYKNMVINSSSTNLTIDLAFLNATINSWQPSAGTCICCGINDAAQKLSQQSIQDRLKVMIIMSDGEANVVCVQQGTGNPRQDAINAACEANSSLNNLVIWSIGVGDADEATLTSIANCGGGRYFPVANASELINIYGDIANQIDKEYQSKNAINYLSIIFYNGTDSFKDNIYTLPEILQSKAYHFNLQGQISGKITKIEIYPIAVTSSREEIIGPLMDSWKAN